MRASIGRQITPRRPRSPSALRGLRLLAAALLSVVPNEHAVGQQAFGTQVTLVAVDATVIDREGRPVSDLQPEEFGIEVDGRPRRVVSAEFLRHAPPLGATEPQAGAPPARPFASNQQGLIGRLIVLVPDVGNLTSGGARGAIEAARRFLDRLGPDDRVALAPIPVGPSVDFTSDHSKLRAALAKVTGSDRPRGHGMRSISLAEAFAFMNRGRGGDSRLWSAAVGRECVFGGGVVCQSECEAEAADIYQDAKATTAMSVSALRRLLRALAAIPAPKTVVLLSQKLVTGSSMGEMGADRALADVGEAAAEARASLYTIYIDRAFLQLFDVSEHMAPYTLIEDARLRTDGLEAVAGHAGGQLFKVVASADLAFDRIASETSGSWLLSFEPQEQDRDGRPHGIKVRVSRDAVQVRARPSFVVATAQLQPAAADLVRREIDSPLPARALPVSVGAFTLTRSGGNGVTLLLAAEVGSSAGPDGGLAVAYRLVDEKGAVLGGVVDAPSFRRIHTTAGERLYYTATHAAAPGRYRLRFAAADTQGRVGGVELLVDAQLRTSGSLGFSDLLVAEVGEPGQTASLSLTGSVPVGSVRAYVEMLGPPDAMVSQVLFELCPGVDTPARLAALASLTPQDDPGRYRAEAVIDLQSLPPGDYVLRALASQGEVALGQAERPLTLVKAPATPVPGAAPLIP